MEGRLGDAKHSIQKNYLEISGRYSKGILGRNLDQARLVNWGVVSEGSNRRNIT